MPIRNLILTGGIFHPFEESSAALAEVLEAVDVRSTITLDIEGGLRALGQGAYDLLTVNALRWTMTQHEKYEPYRAEWAFELSPEGQDALTRHVGRGGGLIALHTASICFDTWKDWATILGGAWVWPRSHHPPKGPVSVTFRPIRQPIVWGLPRMALEDEIYHALRREPGAVTLAAGRVEPDGEMQPVAWAHAFGDGRVVYDALGHDGASIREATHAQFLRRAALWALGRPDEAVASL